MPALTEFPDSPILPAEYDNESTKLHMRFRDSAENYTCQSVPADIHEKLSSLASNSRCFELSFRGRYPVTSLTDNKTYRKVCLLLNGGMLGFRVNFRTMISSQTDSHTVWDPVKYIGTRILLVRPPSTIEICFIRRSDPEIV